MYVRILHLQKLKLGHFIVKFRKSKVLVSLTYFNFSEAYWYRTKYITQYTRTYQFLLTSTNKWGSACYRKNFIIVQVPYRAVPYNTIVEALIINYLHTGISLKLNDSTGTVTWFSYDVELTVRYRIKKEMISTIKTSLLYRYRTGTYMKSLHVLYGNTGSPFKIPHWQ